VGEIKGVGKGGRGFTRRQKGRGGHIRVESADSCGLFVKWRTRIAKRTLRPWYWHVELAQLMKLAATPNSSPCLNSTQRKIQIKFVLINLVLL